MKKTIHIIGGSIAGCCTAQSILKNSADFSIKIFERLPQKLRADGAGIAIPVDLLESLKQKKYLDPDFSAFEFQQRHFIVSDPGSVEDIRTLWQQPFSGAAIHWNALFKSLREKVPDSIYFSNQEVTHIDCSDENESVITLKSGETLAADLTICADGHSSLGRKLIYPAAQPRYANYIAWRGIIPFEKIKDLELFTDSVPIFLNPKGHLLFYPIFENSQKLLNWVFFEICEDSQAQQLLIDRTGHAHQSSILPGQLSDKSKQYLYAYVSQTLPNKIANMIYLTENPFLQKIYDFFLPTSRLNRLVALGDAATVLVPNIASGATKALQDAMNLGDFLADSAYSLDQALYHWNEQHVQASKTLHRLSTSVSNALILNPPDWTIMTDKMMSQWWENTLKDDKWYATELRAPQHY